MKSWTDLVADVDLLQPYNYTPGRADRIRYVVVHHNGGNLSARQIYNVWLTREASAHYQVDVNGVISQHVNDSDTAWHAGDAAVNAASIGIEHANSSGTSGPLSAATLDNGAHLVAAACRAYQLGRPAWGVNVYPHQRFYSTACPGHLATDQRDAYMSAAQRYYDQMTGAAPTTATPGGLMTPTQLVELLKGVTYGAQGTMVARIERAFQAAESWLKGGANDARLAKIEADLAAIKAKVGA